MANFVLVHGAFTGAHGWHLVRPLLQQTGHDVFTVCLTGLGERAHLSNPDVDLSTHITDISNTIEFWDLSDVVLVGHSYGGMPVTGAADRVADRLAHLIYVDAFVGQNGQSMQDLSGGRDNAPDSEWLVPPVARSMANQAEMASLTPRRQGQPKKTFSEKLVLSQPLEERAFTRTYIKAVAEPGEFERERPSTFMRIGQMAKESPRWNYLEIQTGHMAMNDGPEELVALLLSVVGAPAAASA